MTSQAMTRRAALGAIASVPAIAGAVAAPVLLEKEIPVQKVNRLAAELSEAMDEWMVDISHPDYQRALWVAHVWPSSSGHGIYFKNEGDAVKPTPQQRLDAAIAELKAAAEALDPNIYQWNINTNEDKRCGLLVAAFRTTTKYEGDGWYESPWEWGEVKQYCMDPNGWANGPFAVKLHELLLDHIERGAVEDLYLYQDFPIAPGTQFSVSCFASLGSMYASLPHGPGVLVPDEEESFHTIHHPLATGAPNILRGNAVVSHWSFFPQHAFLNGSNLLDRYRDLAEKAVV